MVGKRKRGRTKRLWCDCVKMDMDELGLKPEMVQDRRIEGSLEAKDSIKGDPDAAGPS